MAKDDYHVLIYRLLAYLYASLKASERPDLDYLQCGTKAFPVGELYWNYILSTLSQDGYITGVSMVPIVGQGEKAVRILPEINITPKGIAYLRENSLMHKAADFLKSAKEIVPGL